MKFHNDILFFDLIAMPYFDTLINKYLSIALMMSQCFPRMPENPIWRCDPQSMYEV